MLAAETIYRSHSFCQSDIFLFGSELITATCNQQQFRDFTNKLKNAVKNNIILTNVFETKVAFVTVKQEM